MTAYSIGVDLGGTNLRAAAIDQNGQILDRVSSSVDNAGDQDTIILNLVECIRGLRSRVGVNHLQGVGIGMPGFIDMETGAVLRSANIPSFDGVPVRDIIQDKLGTRIILENDANAAAMGEKWIGAGKDVQDLLLMTLGTGIGGGIIVGGKILHGFMGMAGEIGHMTVIPEGNPCGCGNHGCLEKHASATAIASMGRMLNLGHDVSAAHVYELALAGNRRAISVFESMGRALGIAFGNLVNIFNFPLYLLTGGPLPAWDLFAPVMLAEVKKRSSIFAGTPTRIERAILGADAGLIGAAHLPFQQAWDLARKVN